MGIYLQRYLGGECEAVWRQLVDLGEAALRPPVLEEATAVTEEVVRRMIHNARVIGNYLADAGYEFQTPGPFVVPADESTAEGVRQIEQEYGELPLILKVWWSHVDHLNSVPSEKWWKSTEGCHTEGIFPAPEIAICSPHECLSISQDWAELIRENWEATTAAGYSTEGHMHPDDVFLLIGPVTSGNDRVGYRFPFRAVDGLCNDEDPSLVEWLRHYYLVKGGLGWIYSAVVPTADGGKEFRSFIHPEDNRTGIVKSMNLVPF